MIIIFDYENILQPVNVMTTHFLTKLRRKQRSIFGTFLICSHRFAFTLTYLCDLYNIYFHSACIDGAQADGSAQAFIAGIGLNVL